MTTAAHIPAITDTAGVAWAINAAEQITINGVIDTTTANVVMLVLINGQLWQQNKAGGWWYKTTNPTGKSWLGGGTKVSPLSATAPGAPTGVTAIKA